MANNLANKHGLKLVPKPAPSSLTLEDIMLLLKRGDPNGPIRLECCPARPYLGVVSNETLALKEPRDNAFAEVVAASVDDFASGALGLNADSARGETANINQEK